MHQVPAQQVTQQVRAPVLVIDVADQGVLDADPAVRGVGVVPGGGENLRDRPAVVDGNDLVAQFIVGGVQADRKGHRQTLVGKPADLRNQSDCGHRDPPGAHPEAFRRLGNHPAHSAHHSVVVSHRLAHAHEHHVAQPTHLAEHA